MAERDRRRRPRGIPGTGRLADLPGTGWLAILILTLGASTAGIAVARSGPSSGAGWASYTDPADRLTVSIPGGWHRAGHRLVPKLLNPREILSLGNFPMPVGGGGDCGRYPEAAIEAMGPGDALISIQETSVGPDPGRQRSMPAWPRPLRLSGMTRSHRPGGSGRSGGPGEPGRPDRAMPVDVWTTDLRVGRRAVWVMAAIAGPRSPALIRQVERILDRIEFG